MSNKLDLSTCIALVTGANGGIGKACCEALTESGAKVVAADLATEKANGIPCEEYLSLDVTQPGQWDTVAGHIRERYGHLDILVNNAGIDRVEKFEEVTFDSWHKTMSVNIDGVFLGIQKLLPMLKLAGPRRRGGASVISMSSIAGFVGADFNAAYCASKGAVRLLTKALAVEFSALGYQVRVNCVCPGGVDTPMVESIFQSFVDIGAVDSAKTAYDMSAAAHALGRMAEPREIANGVCFLAAQESSYMHGAELLMDGGYTAR